jgi:hypothetical protein
MGPAVVESLNKHMEVGKKASEQIMIKLMFGFINGVGDFTAQGNTTDIILRVSHHPLLSVGFGKQHACRELSFFLGCSWQID